MLLLAGTSNTRCCSADESREYGGVADLLLAGEEHEDVARSLALELPDGVGDGGDLVAVLVGFPVGVVDRAVADLDGVGAAGHLDDRGGLLRSLVLEVLGEALRVDRRGGDDHLEVGAPR